MWWLVPFLLAPGCARRPPVAAEVAVPSPSRLEEQRARAAEEGPSQTLEIVRLASIALAEGETDEAEAALRQAVLRMQDFRADGQFRAMVGAESRKEWKGDPYEKMMAFLYLGLLLFQEEDYGNALAMTKSAILADTGTSRFQYRADFVPAFVLQALAYDRLGEDANAERSMQQAIDAMYLRELTGILSDKLGEVEVEGDPDAVAAARVLLMSGLPAGLAAHPRDTDAAIGGALSRATELRGLVLDGGRKDRPEGLEGLSKGDVRRSFEVFEPMVAAWREAVDVDPIEVEARLAADAASLESLLSDAPSLVLWIEGGRGPRKVAYGEYREILRFVPRDPPPYEPPTIRLGGRPTVPTYLDSLTYQASTRGSRWVDGFLKGKAQFKDAAPFLGWALLASGDIANAMRDSDDSGAVAAVLYALGAATWIAGAATNPAADVRAWNELPETLWLVVSDPPPGHHTVTIDNRRYEVDVPDRGATMHLVPSLPPGGPARFGEPCVECPETDTEAPLAIPGGAPNAPPDRSGGQRDGGRP